MWLFLLGCSAVDSLPLAEPVRGPIPSLVEVDGVQEAVPVVRRMPAPAPLAQVDDEALLDGYRPPYVDDLRAHLLANPDDPLLRTVVERWADDPGRPGHRQLLGWLLQDARICEAVLDLDDGTLGAGTYDSCPWRLRAAVIARYPSAANRNAWHLTPLPDDLAEAFLDDTWPPDAVVQSYPDAGRGRVTRALERCADEAEDPTATARCVQALASLDWSTAQERRQRLEVGHLRELLDRFATGAEVEGWLDAQGFPPRPDDAPIEAGALVDRLQRRGSLWAPTTGVAGLALLLDQVGVNDVTVRILPSTADARYSTVHAFHGGHRYRFLLDPDYGVDIEQLVGVVNLLARRAGAPRRALWVEDHSIGWAAVTGPADGLRALREAGLVYAPDEPMYREGIEYLGETEEAPADTGPTPFQLFED